MPEYEFYYADKDGLCTEFIDSVIAGNSRTAYWKVAQDKEELPKEPPKNVVAIEKESKLRFQDIYLGDT